MEHGRALVIFRVVHGLRCLVVAVVLASAPAAAVEPCAPWQGIPGCLHDFLDLEKLEAIAVEQPDNAFLGMELIDAYLAAGRLDEAEAGVRRYLHRVSCGGQPAPCRPHDRATHYLMRYLDQIRAARAIAP